MGCPRRGTSWLWGHGVHRRWTGHGYPKAHGYRGTLAARVRRHKVGCALEHREQGVGGTGTNPRGEGPGAPGRLRAQGRAGSRSPAAGEASTAAAQPRVWAQGCGLFRTPASPHPSPPVPLAHEVRDHDGMEAGAPIPVATRGARRKRRGWEGVLAGILPN